jgi:hypothetical protein
MSICQMLVRPPLISYSTPWKRLATYEVPDLPACPVGGCTCAWLWVPKGCGQPNMYMQGFKCTVTGATATHAVAPAQPPVYCKDDASTCVKGAKQMIVWNQAEGNNVQPPQFVSPGYNAAWGYLPGAQDDIFVPGGSTAPSSSAPAATPTTSSTILGATSSWVSAVTPPVKVVSSSTPAIISTTSSTPVVAASSWSPPTSAPVKVVSTPVDPIMGVSSSTGNPLPSSWPAALPSTLSTKVKPVSAIAASAAPSHGHPHHGCHNHD